MKIESQCCSLELAKKLKELGVKQESYFLWVKNKTFGDFFAIRMTESLAVSGTGDEEIYPAFTSAELGEMLPAYLSNHWKIKTMYVFKPKSRVWIRSSKQGGDHMTGYWGNTGYAEQKYKDIYWKAESANTEADARAKMLVYLIENKLITI